MRILNTTYWKFDKNTPLFEDFFHNRKLLSVEIHYNCFSVVKKTFKSRVFLSNFQ